VVFREDVASCLPVVDERPTLFMREFREQRQERETRNRFINADPCTVSGEAVSKGGNRITQMP
jgi:hypothetical protein